MKTVIQTISTLVQAIHTCEKYPHNTGDWETKHRSRLEKIAKEYLPHGSGFDAGTEVDVDNSTEKKIKLTTSFHHMNADGYYIGWTDHVITVTPAFSGVDITVSGRNKDEIKSYIHETFNFALNAEIKEALTQPYMCGES